MSEFHTRAPARRPRRIAPIGRLLILSGLALQLGGCNNLTRSLGLTRDAPDEFAVTTRAPLVMPPNFDLPSPTPGVPRPQEAPERRQAEEALVPQTALGGTAPTESPGQAALVSAAGPPAPPNIRAQVNAETDLDAPKQTFIDKLKFWQSPPLPGTVVDAAAESQRLRQNAALGQSPETGDTPIVQPKRKSMVGSINPF